jgi:hypothetical protein
MREKKQKKQMLSEERINFFLKIHKSIVLPDFFAAATNFSGKTVCIFVAQLCLLTAAISGGAYTYCRECLLKTESLIPEGPRRIIPPNPVFPR